MSRRTPTLLFGTAVASAAAVAATLPATSLAGRSDQQSTQLISRALDGGVPNGPSTNAVISGDKRYSRLIAFESEASNLVAGDSNGQKDVFAIKRAGSVNNKGTPWKGGKTILVSRGVGGAPANGPSYEASVSGAFRKPGKCVAFLSGASNLVAGDTNGKVDAFLAKAPGRKVTLVSRGSGEDVTGVSVSGDCSRVSYTTSSGSLYTAKGRKVKKVAGLTGAADPSYAQGASNALVVGGSGGVYLSSNGTGRAKLVAPGGRNPAFNDLKRRTLAYEKSAGGQVQIAYKDLGKREKIISARSGSVGNASSSDPVIGNSGYYVTFESHASNLGVNALGRTGDSNGKADAYLYTNVRDITLVQSVERKAEPVPGGGENPSMSYYANYVLFDSPAPLGSGGGHRQIFMRYLGEV